MADNARVRAPNMACSNQLRRLIINSYTVNLSSIAQIAATFLIPQRTVQRILARFYADNETDKKKQGEYRAPK